MPDAFSFTLDNVAVTVVAEPKSSALAVLDEQLGVMGVRPGCAPQGLCGCCTVLVDGKPRLTCTLPIKALAGKVVTTLASVPAETKARIASAFAAAHAAQCGYCTPAIVLSATTLLDQVQPLTEEGIERALALHTCRCTGYAAIKAAIGVAVTSSSLPSAPAPAAEVILGLRPFVADLERPGLRHGAVAFAGAASGVIRAVVVTDAEAMPGEVRVLVLKRAGEVEHAGEIVAAVSANSRAEARAAAAAVRVEIEPGPLRTPTPLARAVRREGNTEGALAAAAHRAALTLRFAPTDAVPLEPEAALAVPDGAGGVTVYSAGHDARGLADTLSAALGAQVRVVLVPSGGSYGAKAVASVEAAAAALALADRHPVRVALSHEEGTSVRARRPAGRIEADLAIDAHGNLVAARMNVTFEGGCRAHEVERLLDQATNALVYAVPNVEIVAEVYATSGSPTGPVRGAGAAPVVAAVEALLDRLAEASGVDRIQLRKQHLSGEVAKMMAALEASRPSGPESWGLAISQLRGGHGAEVVLHVTGGSDIEVQCNVPELGQGRDRQLIEALVETTGLPPAVFDVVWADSDVVGPAGEGPVEEAAAAAGRALAEAGGSLMDLVGRRFSGKSEAAPNELVGCITLLGVEGAIGSVRVLAAAAGDLDSVVHSLAVGGAAMGVGVALSEEVAATDGWPDTRFRTLGTLKARQTPRIEGASVAFGGGARGCAEAATIAAAAATYAAVQAFEGVSPPALPMKASAAAHGVGVRLRGSAQPSG